MYGKNLLADILYLCCYLCIMSTSLSHHSDLGVSLTPEVILFQHDDNKEDLKYIEDIKNNTNKIQHKIEHKRNTTKRLPEFTK